ncbi:MAG: permease prefix domain 1-containing protein [Lachnospiraceae bacterium]|nr:permease prefix domain 1-containing protein [Lachnospiraceae bacterium]
MDTIKTYLDNIFAAFPQNEKLWKLKNEMQADMIEKYQELKNEGKSEHEAVGSVIANFGSIEEIIGELGIEKNETITSDERILISNEKAKEYLSEIKKSSIWIGAGVWLILIGVSITNFLSNNSFGFAWAKLDAFGALIFFSFIAVAVIFFIVNGIRMGKYEDYVAKGVRLDFRTQTEITNQSERFNTRYTIHIAGGVAMILLGVGSFTIIDEFRFENMATTIFLMIIGFAVFLFITAGMIKGAYDLLLTKGEHKNKAGFNKAGKIIGTLACVYWPMATIVYLIWSFVGEAWTISWLVWPVSGILFGAIAGGVGAWYSQEK